MAKGTLIHGVAASENLDSSGERIIISGLDISSLERGEGVLNYEHKNENASQIIGKVIRAKKIFAAEDCETKEELYFWNRVQLPFLYIIGELFDAVGHQQAQEVAAMLRYDTEKRSEDPKSKNVVNFSIEGAKLEKQGSEITRAIARKLSITVAPCNKAAVAEELRPAAANAEPAASKSPLDVFKTEQDYSISVLDSDDEIRKSFPAPGALTGTQALTRENLIGRRKKAEDAFNNWPHRDKLIKLISNKKPELSKHEVEALAKVYALRMTEKAEKSIGAMEKIWGSQKKTEKDTGVCKPTHEGKEIEPLQKPYSSDAQRRWAHTDKGTKALGGKKAVRHWDEETKSKRLPEKVEKTDDANVSRHIWHPEKLKEGSVIEYDGKSYRVHSQGPKPQDSANFKNRYYTAISSVEKKPSKA